MNPGYDLLLVGAGHAHLGVLRHWALEGHPHPWQVALVCPDPAAWYSGMMSGLVAEDYPPAQCRIPLAPLCKAAGVELILQPAQALRADDECLQLQDGRELTARWVSLNVGSVPRLPACREALIELLPVKPFAAFCARWQAWRREPRPLAVIGGGAAGVELAMSMARHVPQVTLFSSHHLLPGHPPALRRRALRHLHHLRVTVHEQCRISEVRGDTLLADGVPVWEGTRAVVATGPRPLPWLSASGLQLGDDRFVAIRPTLQSTSHPRVFASGDCASLPATPHSGVYAVRQAPVLAQNLVHALQNEPLATFRPQHSALALLLDGERGALLSWSRVTAEGRLLRHWKDRLDRGFIERHRHLGRG